MFFKYKWIFVLLFVLGVQTACNSQRAASSEPTVFTEFWIPILNRLNSSTPERPPSFTQKVNEDLLQLNQKEMRSIEADWKIISEKNPVKNKTDFRRKKNQFFHEKVTALNAQALAALNKTIIENPSEENYRKLARKTLARIESNPLTRTENVHQIKDGNQIGFCFSRALLIHYWLLQEKVPQNAIVKVFVLGELTLDGTFWQFHVAILVRDPIDGFIVIDPLQNDILPYKKWLEIASTYEIKTPQSRARFYVVSPTKFLPAYGAYHLDQLEDPVLKPYFLELGESLKAAP